MKYVEFCYFRLFHTGMLEPKVDFNVLYIFSNVAFWYYFQLARTPCMLVKVFQFEWLTSFWKLSDYSLHIYKKNAKILYLKQESKGSNLSQWKS